MSTRLMQWERPLYALHASLDSVPDSVSDNEALSIIELIEGRLQTNCDSAAQYLFFSIAPICQRKPHLMEDLIVRALRPLYYLGIEESEAVVDWLGHFTALRKPYVELTSLGRTWIEDFKLNQVSIRAGLARVAMLDAPQ